MISTEDSPLSLSVPPRKFRIVHQVNIIHHRPSSFVLGRHHNRTHLIILCPSVSMSPEAKVLPRHIYSQPLLFSPLLFSLLFVLDLVSLRTYIFFVYKASSSTGSGSLNIIISTIYHLTTTPISRLGSGSLSINISTIHHLTTPPPQLQKLPPHLPSPSTTNPTPCP